MAICREFYFPSSDGSSRIHAVEWTPESGEIIGVLQIAHGVAEYGMRYAPFAEFMTEHGFAVVANDHLGHGLSAEKDADTLYFGPRDGWKHVVDDMYALRCRTKEKYPDVPYFLMGHSMSAPRGNTRWRAAADLGAEKTVETRPSSTTSPSSRIAT